MREEPRLIKLLYLLIAVVLAVCIVYMLSVEPEAANVVR